MARFVAFAAILTSSFATVLNASMIRIAYPQLQAHFGFTYSELTWVGNSYQIAYAVLLPVLGLIGDKYGRRRCLVTGLIAFGTGSLLCGFTWNFWSLIAFRLVQAIGASAIFPNAVATATRLFPEENRGKVMGLWGMAISLGSVSGPSIGGVILQHFTWQYIFLFNIPFTLLALASIISTVKSDSRNPGAFKFDLAGSAVLALFIVSSVLGLQNASEAGWQSPLTLALLIIGVSCIPLFRRIETDAHEPIVDLTVIKTKAFLSGLYCGGMHLVAIQATHFMMPLFLANVMGMDALAIGILMIPQAAIRLFVSPLAGFLEDKFGCRLPITAGIIIRTVSLATLAFLTPSSPDLLIVLVLLADGAGAALVWSPSMNAVLKLVPAEKTSSITGVFNMLRFIMGVFGVVATGLALDAVYVLPESQTALVPGFFHSYIVLALLTVASLAFVKNLGAKATAPERSVSAD